MAEIVKYNNDLNKLKFTGFSKSDMNVFMYLCSQVKEKGTDHIRLTFSQIREKARFSSTDSGDLIRELDGLSERLLKVNSKIIMKNDDGKRLIIRFDLFPTFIINETDQVLEIAVNDQFVWLLNEFTGYTVFELEEFVELRSKYAKSLYRILKQWRTTGAYTFHDVEEFRQLLDVPKKYSNNIMARDCIQPAVEDIKRLDGSFKDLTFETLRSRKRGQPVTGYRFTWTSEVVPEKKKPGRPRKNPAAVDQAQQETKKGENQRKQPYQNRFNNFNQREYDWSEMEKMMLQQSKQKE